MTAQRRRGRRQRPWRLLLAVVAAGSVVAGALGWRAWQSQGSRGAGPTQSAEAQRALSVTLATRSGCGAPPPFTGRRALSVTVGDRERRYDALVPTHYDPNRRLALVLVFHAASGNIEEAVGWNFQQAAGARDGAVFLFPQALPFRNLGVGWDEACDGIDMPFFDAMVQRTAESFCVATDGVFATGFSWGADFVNALGCCRAGVLRGLVAHSGGEWGPEIGANRDCGTAPMPAYRLAHGDADKAYTPANFDSTVQLFAAANHCSGAIVPTAPAPCVAFTGCERSVSRCRYGGLGHEFAPNYAADTWAFFSSLR